MADGRDKDANRDSLDKVCGDRSFTCPTKELTDIYSRRGIDTYFYYLSYRASTEVWPDWMGVIHGADIQVNAQQLLLLLLLRYFCNNSFTSATQHTYAQATIFNFTCRGVDPGGDTSPQYLGWGTLSRMSPPMFEE